MASHDIDIVVNNKHKKNTNTEKKKIKTYRVGSFNVENLLARYEFNKAQLLKISKESLHKKGTIQFGVNDLVAYSLEDEKSKQITAESIKEINADILCLMEVESLQVLDLFNEYYLKELGYTYTMLIDGRDPRNIDVGILSKYPIVNVRSNRHAKNPKTGKYIFARDLLEVDVDLDGKILTLYVTHLTSMSKGREETYKRRLDQVNYIYDRIEKVWKEREYKGDFIICGDFNDKNDEESSIKKLLNHSHLVESITNSLPEEERWTHYYAKESTYNQLDYFFLSKQLSEKNKSTKPVIFRRGLPSRAERYKGSRIEGVGYREPKASDHCPVYMDLIL
ncbi:hypothetical protein ABK040_008396 [Willaertia magna]